MKVDFMTGIRCGPPKKQVMAFLNLKLSDKKFRLTIPLHSTSEYFTLSFTDEFPKCPDRNKNSEQMEILS